MVVDFKTARGSHFRLAFLDFRVVEFLDVAALHAHQMIVVAALIELENGFVRFKVMADQQARLLKLQQHAVHRGEAGVGAVFLQQFVDFFSRQVAHRAFLKEFEDAQARQSGFKAAGLQIFG